MSPSPGHVWLPNSLMSMQMMLSICHGFLSQDLNPNEHLWHILEQHLRQAFSTSISCALTDCIEPLSICLFFIVKLTVIPVFRRQDNSSMCVPFLGWMLNGPSHMPALVGRC